MNRVDELAELLTKSDVVSSLIDFYQGPKPQPSPRNRPEEFKIIREALEEIKNEGLYE